MFETVSVAELEAKGIDRDSSAVAPLVLVVDDEELVAYTTACILRLAGFAVLTAYDGVSALKLAQLAPPEIVLTDMLMPGMNGHDLALAIRACSPDCEILLVSAIADQGELISGEFRALSKPLHPEELLREVTAVAHGRLHTLKTAWVYP